MKRTYESKQWFKAVEKGRTLTSALSAMATYGAERSHMQRIGRMIVKNQIKQTELFRAMERADEKAKEAVKP